MKQKIFIIFLIITICIAFPIIYRIIKINKAVNNVKFSANIDQKTFKYEYEVLNSDNKNDYIKINIDENNKIKYTTFEEINSLLNNGTGIIYFGFPSCPWCRRTLPVFFDTCSKYNIDKIYYYNALDIRDIKHLDDNGNIIVDKAGDEKYYKLVDMLYDYLGQYVGLNDSSIKRLYFPTYVFVKDGKILGVQISSVSSYTSVSTDMTDEQKNELSAIFENYLNSMYEKVNICNDEKLGSC